MPLDRSRKVGALLPLGSAPYFSLALRGWVPCVVSWDPTTGRFTRVEGPDGFTTWEEAEEASGFLTNQEKSFRTRRRERRPWKA